MPVFYRNLGAEEDDAPPPPEPPSHLRLLAEAWERAIDVAADLGLQQTGLLAWLNTPRARRAAEKLGLPLAGADPAIVAAVHDKGFCARAVRSVGLLEAELVGAVAVLDAHETTVDRLVALTLAASATPWVEAGLIAKPRHGTSGRGRLDLRRGVTMRAAARLQRRGGVVVEPWLPRVADYSSQWWIEDTGLIRFVGATQATQSFAGMWQGARMWIDDDGCPTVPGLAGREVVDRSQLIVREAARAGYVGPCGVDVFSWRAVDDSLRWRVCELNARMTGGLVAVLLAHGLVRRGAASAGEVVSFADGVASVRGGSEANGRANGHSR
jgi:hypothetical protein